MVTRVLETILGLDSGQGESPEIEGKSILFYSFEYYKSRRSVYARITLL